MMKTMGTWILRALATVAKILLRLGLFMLGSVIRILGKAIEKVGDELITASK